MRTQALNLDSLDKAVHAGLIQFIQKFSDDKVCRTYLEAKLWPKGPVCPHCQSKTAYRITGKTARQGLCTCKKCRKQFTVTIGTIFEGSHLPLSKWFASMYLMCASKKGISAHQIHRSLKITYKTAWFVCHRIRLAMQTKSFNSVLSGTVEVDETYIGGKRKGDQGRRAKTIVFGMFERGGSAVVTTIPRVHHPAIDPLLTGTIKFGSKIVTDELSVYRKLPAGYESDRVNHKLEYVSDSGAHINSAESFWALFKRGVHGTFHHISKHRAHMYCGEFGFRYNTRKVTDGERFIEALTYCTGRLKWHFKTA